MVRGCQPLPSPPVSLVSVSETDTVDVEGKDTGRRQEGFPKQTVRKNERAREEQLPSANAHNLTWIGEEASMEHQQGRVERFLKLGYSQRDILRVLESLHHEAQTNDILEELIKTCQTNTSTATTRSKASLPAHNSPQLIPRGCSPPQTSSSPSPPPLQLTTSTERDNNGGFRPVVIDGSNVAISHGNKKVFSCRGLQLAVRWFWEKGLRDITVFVPLWRKEQPRPDAPITDQHILHELEKRKILVYTPSRCVNGKRVVCYDDRYIIKLAYDSDGIIVSNDNYRDLQIEKPQWKKFIEERLLMYSFANDKFMPPDDPLGRNGPTIDNFLLKKPWTLESQQQHCPYGKKCTYGVKCKFYHPERSNQSQLSVADELRAKSKPVADREQPYVLIAPAGSQGSSQEALVYTAPYHEPDRTAHQYRYPSTPPPLRSEDHPHRGASCELFTQLRDPGSPGLLRPPSLRLYPSPDTDEAFGSMESSLSRLYIQDSSRSLPKPVSCAYSSGVAGCSQGSEDSYYSFRTQGYLSSEGYHTPNRGPQCGCDRPCSLELPACNHVVYGQKTYLRGQSLSSTGRGSYPGPFPRDENAHLGYYSKGHSLPDYPWGQCPSNTGAGQREEGYSGEDRRNVSIQLSTLFPQSIVEQVMSQYPHILDTDKLIPLIHNFRTSHCSF